MALARSIKLWCFCFTWLLVLVAFSPHAFSAEEITVTLESGRSFTGYVDDKTNDSQLVLRFEEGWATLWRPIAWRRIVNVEHHAKKISPNALRQEYHNLSSQSAVEQWLATDDAPSTKFENPPPRAEPRPPRPLSVVEEPVVQSIMIRASLANWNRGAERDGLMVTLYPLDSQGQVIPVSGTIEIKLLGLRRASVRSKYVYARGTPFPALGRWTRQIFYDDVTASGVQFQLPFQSFHPEFKLDLAPHGMVQVRLTIPGQGTFSETVELIRIRPFSPIRDFRQQLKGTRFFPQETLSRTK